MLHHLYDFGKELRWRNLGALNVKRVFQGDLVNQDIDRLQLLWHCIAFCVLLLCQHEKDIHDIELEDVCREHHTR